MWGPDGSVLYYRSGTRFLAVDVTTVPAFEVLSTPRLIFDRAGYFTKDNGFRGWDVHPDGSRFLFAINQDRETVAQEVYLVTNWFTELRQRTGN